MRRIASLLALAATLALTMAAFTAAGAQAGIVSEGYCNRLVAARTACWAEDGGGPAPVSRLIKNSASYPGSGTVSVCERIADEALNNYSRRCANNFVESGSDIIGNRRAFALAWIAAGNNSEFSHTINGIALQNLLR